MPYKNKMKHAISTAIYCITCFFTFNVNATNSFNEWYDYGASCVFKVKETPSGVCSGFNLVEGPELYTIIVSRTKEITVGKLPEEDFTDTFTGLITIRPEHLINDETVKFSVQLLLREAHIYKAFLDKNFPGQCNIEFSGNATQLIADTECKVQADFFKA